jgi:hypothetical protein
VAVEDPDAFPDPRGAEGRGVQRFIISLPAEYGKTGPEVSEPVIVIKDIGGEFLVHTIVQVFENGDIVVDDLPFEEKAFRRNKCVEKGQEPGGPV